MLVTCVSVAQKKEAVSDVQYRRSSLHRILLESESFPKKDAVMDSYNSAPFPEKYNNHEIAEKSFNPLDYLLTNEEKAANSEPKTGFGNMASGIAKNAKEGIVDSLANDMPLIISKYFKENNIANKLVAKWYDRKTDGSFGMNLICERGYYNASEMEANIAKGSARGTSVLADAGVELIKNTFVAVSKMNFVSNEPIAASIREVALASANEMSIPMVRKKAIDVANKIYEKTKEGYLVMTTSYLYQLDWNESIENTFYNDLYMDQSNIDIAKVDAFDKSDLFQMKYIGKEHSNNLVTFSLKENRTEEQVINLATVRNVDKVYAKLQKKYDVFKTKTPLYSGFPITAKIGMKEGLEGGEKFEVFEQVLDSKTGLTKYVSKGNISVETDKVWDNRFIATSETDSEKSEINVTSFKGGKNFYSGMLIRQIK